MWRSRAWTSARVRVAADGHKPLPFRLGPGGDEAERLEPHLLLVEVVPGVIAFDDVAVRVDDWHGALLDEPFSSQAYYGSLRNATHGLIAATPAGAWNPMRVYA